MTNRATRDKIKQACKLYSVFSVEKSRLICKICKTYISVTSRTKMMELEEHFKTIKHLKHVNGNDAVNVKANASKNRLETPEPEFNETISSINESNDVSDGNESNLVDNMNNIDNGSNLDNGDNVNPIFTAASPGSAVSKNSSVKIEVDDDIKCEYIKVNSTNRLIKQEPGNKPCIDFLPANQLFYTDLIQLCLTTNISFTKLTGPDFRSFFQKHFNRPIPTWDEIRAYFLKPMYETKMCKLKALVSQHNIYLIVKQHWCDGRGNIVTLLVGALDGNPARSHLYKVSVMKNVDLTILSQEIIAILHNLYQGLAFDKLSLLVTDNCPLSIQIGNFLKTLFPKLRHVVCLIISLDYYCEAFRSQHKLLSEYVSIVNSIFDSSPNLSSQFKNAIRSISFPLGRPNLYGSQWMEAVEIFCSEFSSIISILGTAMTDSKTDVELREKIERLTLLFDNKELQDELIDFNGYRCLRETIKLLESDIYNLPQIRRRIEVLGRNPKRSALIKMVKETMWKNPDLEYVLNLAEDLNSSDEDKPSKNPFKYAPLCVTDSFKCFKLFRTMLEENGEISDQDLETLTFLAYNQGL